MTPHARAPRPAFRCKRASLCCNFGGVGGAGPEVARAALSE
jgi:hypothetical protein